MSDFDNNKGNLSQAPVLVELSRGLDADGQDLIDCVHRGLISVVDGQNQEVFSLGDVNTYIHLRSTSKPFQVLPLLEQGFFSAAKLDSRLKEEDLVLFMSSHGGEAFHCARVAQILQAWGFVEEDLRCGIHPPQDESAYYELISLGRAPTELHNCCSGKHVAMLMACQALGFDIFSYEKIEHPLQKAIKQFVALFANIPVLDIKTGIDGCSLPSFCLPIKNLALMYANLAFWPENLPKDKPAFLSGALSSIWTAIKNHPQFLAGTTSFDTVLIKASGGQIISKIGADGVHALAVKPCEKYPTGLGIAIKISDGDHKKNIRPLVVKTILKKLNIWPEDSNLEQFMPKFSNYRNIIYGRAVVKI